MTAVIGVVPLAVREAAVAFILDAVRMKERGIDALARELCQYHRPPALVELDLELAVHEARVEGVPLCTRLFYEDQHGLTGLYAKRAELLKECIRTARGLIMRLAEAGKVVVEADVVSAA